MHFMNAIQYTAPGLRDTMSPYERWQKVQAGVYTGVDNATVRVVGKRGNEHQWVKRNKMGAGEKGAGYKSMNMTHFSSVKPKSDGASCLMRVYQRFELEDVLRVNENDDNKT